METRVHGVESATDGHDADELKACNGTWKNFAAFAYRHRDLWQRLNVSRRRKLHQPDCVAFVHPPSKRLPPGLLGRAFGTIVRKASYLQELLNSEPFAEFNLAPEAKHVITFLRSAPTAEVELPPERDGARILRIIGNEVLCAYIPSPRGPAFMSLLKRTFGKTITTRSVETVRKCAWA